MLENREQWESYQDGDNKVVQRAVRGTLKNRMQKVIKVVIVRGHDVLMLGAFGCGVFGNDPQVVATIEQELLEREDFARFFDLIVNQLRREAIGATSRHSVVDLVG
jgi:uncharacterized protein (TIGR02452 family)